VHHVEQMLKSHPMPSGDSVGGIATCIVACLECATSCTTCADACVAEDDYQTLARCIRLNLDCAAVCRATAEILARENEPDWNLIRSVLETCELACSTCGEECDRHTHMKHCELCAESCRECASACRTVSGAAAA
jgi:hypothetical protein